MFMSNIGGRHLVITANYQDSTEVNNFNGVNIGCAPLRCGCVKSFDKDGCLTTGSRKGLEMLDLLEHQLQRVSFPL